MKRGRLDGGYGIRTVRGAVLGLVVTLVVAGLAVTTVAGGAGAATGQIAVPRQGTGYTDLALAGASSSHLLVVQGPNGVAAPRVLAGAGPGSLLLVGAAANDRGTWPRLVGDTLVSWSRDTGGALVVDSRSLTSGTTTSQTVGAGSLLAASAAGLVVQRPDRSIVLRSGGADTTLVADGGTVPDVVADDTGMLARVGDQLILVEFAGPTTTVVVPSDPHLGTPALAPGTLAWTSWDGVSPTVTLHRRPRSGGTETTRTMPPANYAVSDTATAWVVGAGGTDVVVAPADPAAATTAVTLPGPVDRPVARGSAFLTTVSGDPATVAGVYAVSAGTAGRIATVPAEPERTSDLTLSPRGLHYATDRSRFGSQSTVFRRPLSTSGAVVVGAESAVTDGVDGLLSASGARLAYTLEGGAAGWTTYLTDRGQPGPAVPGGSGGIEVSGGYLLVDGVVRRADTGAVVRRPAAGETGWSLFGPRLAWRTTGTDDLRVLDLGHPVSPTNPRTLGRTGDIVCPCTTGRTAVGGRVVAAWIEGDSALHLYPLAGGTERVLTGGGITQVRAAGSVVAWAQRDATGTAYEVQALDTAVPGAVPVLVGGADPVAPVVGLDGDRIAWTGTDGRILVAPVPGAGPQRPRLLGALAAGAFSPDGNGRADSWTPVLDVSKPLSGARLTIRHGSTVVRSFSVAVPDGGVRGVTWDGRDAAGDRVPDAVYTWTLTGTAVDGDGAVAAVDGTSAATGTVTVDRTGTTTTVRVPTTSAQGAVTASLPVSWAPAADLAGNAAVSFDVRYRAVNVSSAGVVSYGAPVGWLTGTTARSRTFGTSLASGSRWQFSARTRDTAGNVGPWSAWRTTSVSVDDASLTATSGWTRGTDASAYLGTVSTSSRAGDALTSATTWSTAVTVVGTTCPTCGAVRVIVDGTVRATVDTASAMTAHRRTLYQAVLPKGRHTVRLVVVGTTGRPEVRIDAVGFRLP